MQTGRNKLLTNLIIVSLFFISLLNTALTIVLFFHKLVNDEAALILITLSVFIFGLNIIAAKLIFERDIYREYNKLSNETIGTLNKIIKIQRAERHDFVSHLQTAYGFLCLGKAQVAQSYLKELVSLVKIYSRLMCLSQPAIVALLIGKIPPMMKEEIDFIVDIQSNLANLQINPIHCTSIIGNLIDNAIEAVRRTPPGQRYIKFSTWEDDSCYYIRLTDSGPEIPEDIRGKILLEGFSTKGDGRGFGLHIVNNTVKAYGGKIICDFAPTTFTLSFPRESVRK